MLSPYADILAQREAARRDRKPVALHIPARMRDLGTPSPDAIAARNARLAADTSAADLLAAKLEARGDYAPLFGYAAHPFTSTRRS